jgi:hypothetical protein
LEDEKGYRGTEEGFVTSYSFHTMPVSRAAHGFVLTSFSLNPSYLYLPSRSSLPAL